jgi:hypothetical protein
MELNGKKMTTSNAKVFGIGLPRSGTSSLNLALIDLGYEAIHHPTFFIMDKMKGDYEFPGSWDALTNFGEHFFPQLDERFPNSKFILTIRDKENWLNSCRWKYKDPSNHLSNAIRISIFGCDRFHESTFSRLYDAHRDGVLNYFKDRPQDLLVFNCDRGHSWRELCAFLGKPSPDIPFPHKNSKQEIVTAGKPVNYRNRENLHLKNLRHFLHGEVLNRAFLGNPLAEAVVSLKRGARRG